MENPGIISLLVQMGVEALYRLSDRNGFSLLPKEFRYAEIMGDSSIMLARKFAVVSTAYPDLPLEIVVRGVSMGRPYSLEILDAGKPLSRQETSEYERIAKLVDDLNELLQRSEPATIQAQSPDATPTKRITSNQKAKQERQARVMGYCKSSITVAEMARKENVSESTINRDIADLKSDG